MSPTLQPPITSGEQDIEIRSESFWHRGIPFLVKFMWVFIKHFLVMFLWIFGCCESFNEYISRNGFGSVNGILLLRWAFICLYDIRMRNELDWDGMFLNGFDMLVQFTVRPLSEVGVTGISLWHLAIHTSQRFGPLPVGRAYKRKL